jgi:hypothetical protein
LYENPVSQLIFMVFAFILYLRVVQGKAKTPLWVRDRNSRPPCRPSDVNNRTVIPLFLDAYFCFNYKTYSSRT